MKIILLITTLMLCVSGCTGVTYKGPNIKNSCETTETDTGYYIKCGQDELFINHGTNGQDGSDGQDGINAETTVKYVEVCPDVQPQDFNEVLLYIDGIYIAYWDDPDFLDRRLVVLEDPKCYKTTDARDINFCVKNKEIICP